MADAVKSKTFSMVAAICSFVVGVFALVESIYQIVYGFQAFGADYDHHVLAGIFDLVEAVILLGMTGVCVFLGLKLLAGSKLAASTNPIFNQWFTYMAGLYEINAILSAVAALILGSDAGYWVAYLIVLSLFLIGTIVMMIISKGNSGLNSSIFFFIGVGCFLIANGYTLGGWWLSVLFSLAFIGFEVMAVLARVLEDKLGK